ncbi:MAG: mechanosensitive ion channel family protein, partial [Deltaproteobacteria bacterium]|nr:mechanosensitive ion channel family protein [Deltaproteobacteria bacterium]
MENLANLQQLLDQTFAGISLLRLISVFIILFLALLLKRIFAHLLTKTIFKAAQKTSTKMDDLLLKNLDKPAEFLIVVFGVYVAVEVLQLPSAPTDIDRLARNVVQILLTFNLAWFCYNAVTLLDHWLKHWAGRTESTLDDQLVPFIRKSLRIFIV